MTDGAPRIFTYTRPETFLLDLARLGFVSRGNILFRGQADTAWPLETSLHRCMRDRFDKATPKDLQGRCKAFEEGMVSRLGQHLINTTYVNPAQAEAHRYCAAMAQHQGVPTRMMDWTRSPFVAAYFAVAPVAHQLKEGKRLSVFALSLPVFPYDAFEDRTELRESASDTSQPTQTVSATSETPGNENMLAQQGVVAFIEPDACLWPDSEAVNGDEGGVDRLAHEYEAPFAHLRIRLDLPWTQARELLNSLRNVGYSASRLFPGQRGACLEAADHAFAQMT